jgi:hypothetical protein
MKYFSKIDLNKGFYQVSIKEADKCKTAFSTNMGKYEFNRVPFGILNAPKFFHNLISEVVRDMNNVAVFVDDLIIFSKTEEEQLNSIKLILGKFIEKNIFINNEKSSFCTEKLTYLGFQIDQHGYKPDPSRLEDFTVCDKPKTTKQLQKMLGKINWYRIFVKDISTRLEPFYKQLKRDKNSKLEITDNNMKIVSEIYQELKNDALLYYPDLNAPFYIQADASDAGIGGILFQKME